MADDLSPEDRRYCNMKNGILLRTALSLVRQMEPEGVVSQHDIDGLSAMVARLEDRIAEDDDLLGGEAPRLGGVP